MVERITLEMLAQAAADPYRFQFHPEIWLLIASILAMGVYAVRVIGPKVVPAGEEIVSTAQRRWFLAGVLLLWVFTEWPVHDLAEDYLYAIHMVQHMVLTLIVPPMLLLAVPRWLARLLVPEGSGAERFARTVSHPVAAAVVFGCATMLTHWSVVVNLSVENGPFHYAVHVGLVLSAFLVWMPVCNPLAEMRASAPAQMIYLFLLSVPPTIPGAWLTISEDVVYSGYDRAERLWGMSVIADQQTAGLIMKLAGGFYLWGLIAVLFFRWSTGHQRADAADRATRSRQRFDDARDKARAGVGVGATGLGVSENSNPELTFEDVAAEFEAAGQPRSEGHPPS